MDDPRELRVVIAAGGTGGHLFPGIAVAREFQARHQAAVTFLTTPKAVTTQILERYGLAWEAVSARPTQSGYFSASTGGLGALGGGPRGNLTWLLIFNRMPTASKLTSSPEPP